jgi:hypothetical protein
MLQVDLAFRRRAQGWPFCASKPSSKALRFTEVKILCFGMKSVVVRELQVSRETALLVRRSDPGAWAWLGVPTSNVTFGWIRRRQ